MKVYLLAKRDKRAADIKSWLKSGQADLVSDPARADLFVAAGGDGTLLHAINIFSKYNKPFFGINRGTSGFLLNPVDTAAELEKILEDFRACKLIKLRMLKGEFTAENGKTIKNFFAFNDFYAKASRGNARIMGTVRGQKDFPKLNFEGDGIIICTPQGSTAYNYAAGGSIISLGARQLGVKSICARKPLRAVVPEQKITVEVTHGRADAYADHGKLLSGVKKFSVYPSGKFVTLAFKPGYDFELRRWQ